MAVDIRSYSSSEGILSHHKLKHLADAEAAARSIVATPTITSTTLRLEHCRRWLTALMALVKARIRGIRSRTATAVAMQRERVQGAASKAVAAEREPPTSAMAQTGVGATRYREPPTSVMARAMTRARETVATLVMAGAIRTTTAVIRITTATATV